jgi:hypothetical protein
MQNGIADLPAAKEERRQRKPAAEIPGKFAVSA